MEELTGYAFRRLKHPASTIDFITVDSLRRALNVYDVKDVSDKVLTIMMEMAKEAAVPPKNAKVKKQQATEDDGESAARA